MSLAYVVRERGSPPLAGSGAGSGSSDDSSANGRDPSGAPGGADSPWGHAYGDAGVALPRSHVLL